MSAKQATPTAAALSRLMWRWAVVLVVLGVFALWATWRMSTAANRLPQLAGGASATAQAEPLIDYWTCTMHPQIRQAEPGKCPICGMELVPKYAASNEPGVKPAPAAPAREGEAPTEPVHQPSEPTSKQTMWYRCTMPGCGDVGSDDPDSRCPVCGMKREPVGMVGREKTDDYEITLSERARRLASLETEPVQRRYLSKRIRTVGKIGYDETRHKMVSAWVSGRIDQLFADFTGMVVAKGDHLVKIYSPELLSAQEEYLQALRSAESMRNSGIEASRRSAEQLLRSTRRKLELLGINDVQLETLEQSNTPHTHLVVHAPLGGTIVGKRAMEGMYVRTGDVLYEIADLTHVWLLLDVYEADLPWIQPFQEVRVTAEALPGEEYDGRIAFVDPVVDPTTRTIKVRVNVANPKRRLKPEMFVTAEIEVPMGSGGKPVAPATDAAYACPMHPWETARAAANCPVCEMPMVPIASIAGYSPPGEPERVLSVPRTAILQTGERSLAYVEVEPGTYRGVEVKLGPPARDEDGREYYPVLDGLEEGQRVVTRGNFAIDSQMQLAGKPSLFQPAGSQAHHHREMMPANTARAAKESKDAQTLCPVMGNPIDPKVFVDYRGVRVYFCCPACIEKFRADPAKYIPKLPAKIQAALRPAEAEEKQPDD
jgi:multidrug efflux pump subunit AcrA (membrane-fusion protein)/YHS domain-containing protein